MTRAYRKKPVVIEAVQWTGENHAEMCEFIDPEVFEIIPREGLVIHTLEGDHHASPGDYIIKGVNGEFYPCKPDIFAKTYESATLTPQNDPLTIELKDKLCYVGVDLSTSRDMTAFAWRFPPQPGLVTADWLLGRVLYDIQAMPTLTPPNEWASVDERLPGVSGNYICAVKDKNGSVWTIPAEWSLEMKMWIGAFGEIKNIVTHWMPLPAPPAKEE